MKADPSSFDWESNMTKREADQVLFRAMAFDVMNMRDTVRVLSFPATSWLWEQNLEDTLGGPSGKRFEFLGLEQDPAVHDRMTRRLDSMGNNYEAVVWPTSFRKFVSQYPSLSYHQQFDIIYLDWMGTWSSEKKIDLRALLGAGILAPGGLLLLTVSLARGRPETLDELAEGVSDSSLPVMFYDANRSNRHVGHLKVRGIPHWVETHAEDAGVALRSIMGSVYYSKSSCGGKVSPQLQLMFLREN